MSTTAEKPATLYHLLVEVHLRRPWHNVLTTSDEAFAREALRQFEADGLRARIDRVIQKPK